MEDRLRDLFVTEDSEDGLEFADHGNGANTTEYDLCLVGTDKFLGYETPPCKPMAHVGTFLDYDDKNKKTADKPYLRVRSLFDIRQPLKKGKKVKKSTGDWITCIFRYERLPSFCFICGLIGHIDRHCEQFFQTPEEDIVHAWEFSLRAPNKRLANLGGERWIKEEDDGSPMAVTRVTTAATLPGRGGRKLKMKKVTVNLLWILIISLL
ncbi:hypothetical protein L6452_15558 [Arctium lappa]|uniref:Uncharacterized protein n=1 Tax=Arctium lappa TaxID=4217 RepID=A0ACB9CP07_ARCLA|nr:hypothetical protein L6452_15558 [Arctium lappa]